MAGHNGPPDPSLENRRSFLKLASMLAGLGSALLAGVPALLSFLSPGFRARREADWIKIGDSGGFDSGTPVKVDFAQTVRDAWVESRAMRSVWVYTEDGKQFNVYSAACTHLGCSYEFKEGIFRCPCHQGRFDPKTGAVLGGPPPRPLDRLQTKLENGMLYARM